MEGLRNADGAVTVALSHAEALVFSDVLHRWEIDGTLRGLGYNDPAEQHVIWDLVATLEPLIDEAFSPDYDAVVEAARASLR